jgi:hypothetical protein
LIHYWLFWKDALYWVDRQKNVWKMSLMRQKNIEQTSTIEVEILYLENMSNSYLLT